MRADPKGLEGGLNLYAYVNGNPVNSADPWGLESWSFSNLEQAYQGKSEMLSSIKFPQWVVNAINASNGGSCATRMSNAFNRAGYDLLKNTSVRKVSDELGNFYILSAHEFAQAVNMASQKYRINDMKSICGKKGIIYFENYHIDLYDGKNMVGNGAVTSNYTSKAIYFKELDN